MPNNPAVLRALPKPVLHALKDLGRDISVARKRRQQTQLEVAARMNVDVRTLRRLEAGDPGVALGAYACALWVLGMLKKLRDPTDPHKDAVGHSLAIDDLPKRVRRPRPEF